MHRAFAGWLIAKPWRASVVAAILGFLSPQGLSPIAVAAGAVPVLLLLTRDLRTAANAAVAGCVAAMALLVASGQSIAPNVASVSIMFGAPLGLAYLVQRTGSLKWCFQIAVVAATAVLITIYIALDDPVGQWQKLIARFASQLAEAGFQTTARVVAESHAGSNWGTLVAAGLLTVLGSLFLGCWWHSLLHAPGAFGREFQKLRLGKVLGTLALLIILAAFALDRTQMGVPVIAALLWIATVALACQGLAAAHRLKASGRVGGGWLTATYVLLIVPITMVFMVMLLAGWGVADNWWRRA